MAVTLAFYGGAGTVTGSKYLLTIGDRRVLLECGLFQGLKDLRRRNWDPPPFNPRQLDAVVLSHAHIDHSGYLPLLVRRGFKGPVFCTSSTADLLGVMLLDSAKLQEEEAEAANRHGYSKHTPALPLYTVEDAHAALQRVRPSRYGESIRVTDGATAVFRRAGHILGAATVELQLGNGQPVRLAFSGDLGRWNQPILRDPEFVPEADVVLVESTYGDRTHPADASELLAQIVREAVKRGGALLVPAFAVGRTQHLLWLLRKLEDQGRIPSLPVYADSPMASQVDRIYSIHPEDHDEPTRSASDEDRWPTQFQAIRGQQESKALNRIAHPVIIISASGMATGGRILHHLKMRLPDPMTTVLLVGFQAEGTRGRALQEGATSVKVLGEQVQVRAKVVTLDGLSAHADRDDLLRWLGALRRPPSQAYIVHGEPPQARSLAEAIGAKLGWPAQVAADGQVVTLGR